MLIDGPFGKFTEAPAAPKVLLIAGGIGITLIRPLAEGMAADGFDVRVLYRAHGEGDLVFKKELAYSLEARCESSAKLVVDGIRLVARTMRNKVETTDSHCEARRCQGISLEDVWPNHRKT